MITNIENVELIDKAASEYIRVQRDPNRIYSGHEESHLRSVSRLTELAGLSAGYCSRDLELSRIAGWFHDFERSMNETNESSDERLSADAMLKFTGQIHQDRTYHTSLDEREAIEQAILRNGRPPKFFADRPDPTQWTLPERIQAALFVADKMEANGVWVIARRSQFVGGARLKSPEADLPKYGLKPNQDEVKAVLLEGALRIAFINYEGLYPPVFKPLTARMYDPQRDFMHGLLASKDIGIQEYAQMFLDTKLLTDPNHPNYLQGRKGIGEVPEDPTALSIIFMRRGGLSTLGVRSASRDLAVSAVEAVEYFSSQPNRPLEELVEEWNPSHTHSRKWREGMLTYMSGEWFNQMREQLLLKMKKVTVSAPGKLML